MAQERVLLVVDEVISDADSRPDELEALLRQARQVYIVAPSLVSRLESLCSDLDDARCDAVERLNSVLDYLRGRGLTTQGDVGDEDPLQAIDDALADFPADVLILAMHSAEEEENWREDDVLERLRNRFPMPIIVFLVNRDRTLVRQMTTTQ